VPEPDVVERGADEGVVAFGREVAPALGRVGVEAHERVVPRDATR